MKIPYFPGCALKTTANNFEISAIASAQKLGINLIELPRWNCCGTFYSLVEDNLMHQIAPVRNFIRVEETNMQGVLEDEYRLVTFCSICYNTLKSANDLVKNDADKLKKINLAMDRENDYSGKVKVIHYLELLREIGFERISEKVKKPLQGIRVSPYYGCLLLRPKNYAIDNSEHPTIFEELLKALDVDVINNPYKTQCCGNYHTVGSKHLVVELAYKNLSYAKMNGAEAMVLSCPLCAFNLDLRQEDISKIYRDFHKIPVFFFTQLMAIAFGLDEKACGFDLHHVDPRPLLKEKNLLKA